jgi:RNA polymerase sigma-70 factor (sigma-E family)
VEGYVTFEEFAASRSPVLLRFAVVLTGDPGLAEDVVQEVLIRVHGKWRRISQLDAPESYVRRMVVNEYLSWRRRWARVIPQAEPADRPTVSDSATQHAERDALLSELRKLPPRQRAVLALRYYEGLSDVEIADALGCTPGTVRGYASRALATLRIELRPAPVTVREER